jgi:lipid II:glycine glycyltransferase (peptidoglycan interpeptide bridge formation enzyme)
VTAIRVASGPERSAWDAFVAQRPEGDPLQLWAWGEACRVVGQDPVRLQAIRADGTIAGVAQLIVRRAGLGRTVAYVPHGPLWEREADDSLDVIALILRGLRDFGREARAIVVKLDPRATSASSGEAIAAALGQSDEAVRLRPARFDLQAPTTRIVELLDGSAELWKTWAADARRLARRAEREGVEVRIDRHADAASLVAFSDLLAATGARAGFQARSGAFLAALAAELAPSGSWLLALAAWRKRVLAGMAVPLLADRAYYLYGASSRDPEVRHAYGAYAVMAATMRRLAEDGARTLDMWGVIEDGDSSADRSWEGFSAFKRQFGGRPLRHPGTFDLVVDPPAYRLRTIREALRERLSSITRW